MKKHIKVSMVFVYFFIFLFIGSISYASGITLKWDANTEPDLAGYKIYYGYNSGIYNGININQGNSPIVITILNQNDSNYMNNENPEFSLSGLDYDMNDYYFVVTAYDIETPENESGYSNEVNTVGFNLPTIPQNLTAFVINANRIDLNWEISTDNIGIVGYNIYRNGIIIDNVIMNNYSDVNISPNINYNYTVTASDDDGHESGHSNTVSAMTSDGIPPSIPQNLEALTISSTTIELEWEKSTDNIGVIGYDVYRDFNYIASVIGEISNFVSYTDIGLIPSTLYTYSIVAWDAANNKSGYSDLLSVTTLANNVLPPSGGKKGGCFINIIL